ncbi:MAG: pyrimidine dimer DNA glycosylase/endonuclease V [Nitrososphaeria archaeon]
MVRSWHPIPANALDDTALLAEHNELLIIGKAAAGLTRGWRNHPEVLRWRGHSKALKRRHDEVAMEMVQRGFNHRSPWPKELINEADTDDPPKPWQPLKEMARILDERMRRRSGRPLNWVPPKHDEPLVSS